MIARNLAAALVIVSLPATVLGQSAGSAAPPAGQSAGAASASAAPRAAGAAPPAAASDAARQDVRECWRFGFGRWEPALDWRAAGHEGRSPAEFMAAVARGEASRPQAPASSATWSSAAGDTTLILFPDWWPAGVAVRLESGQAAGDTLRGTATALVANGHATNPVSRIVAIRRSCGAATAR